MPVTRLQAAIFPAPPAAVVKAVVDHLRSLVPAHLRPRIQPHFSMLDATTKIRIVAQMTGGTLRVLVATKAGEMGVDLPDVARVVVYKPHDGLDSVIQMAGRAARRGEQGQVIVYVASNLKKAAEEYTAKVPEEVRAAMSACGLSILGVLFGDRMRSLWTTAAWVSLAPGTRPCKSVVR